MNKNTPNKESMKSIFEAIDDIKDHHLKSAENYEKLEKILEKEND